jgi:hypothetical protein
MIHAPSMRIDRVIATYSKVKGEKRVGKNQDELYKIKINDCTEWLLCYFFLYIFLCQKDILRSNSWQKEPQPQHNQNKSKKRY